MIVNQGGQTMELLILIGLVLVIVTGLAGWEKRGTKAGTRLSMFAVSLFAGIVGGFKVF